jgi:hypothetical protein
MDGFLMELEDKMFQLIADLSNLTAEIAYQTKIGGILDFSDVATLDHFDRVVMQLNEIAQHEGLD